MSNKVRGEYGWLTMAGGIVAYDLWAIKSGKAETLSGAMWRSLEHPMKFPILFASWAILTHHLLLGKKARASYSIAKTTFTTKRVKENVIYHE